MTISSSYFNALRGRLLQPATLNLCVAACLRGDTGATQLIAEQWPHLRPEHHEALLTRVQFPNLQNLQRNLISCDELRRHHDRLGILRACYDKGREIKDQYPRGSNLVGIVTAALADPPLEEFALEMIFAEPSALAGATHNTDILRAVTDAVCDGTVEPAKALLDTLIAALARHGGAVLTELLGTLAERCNEHLIERLADNALQLFSDAVADALGEPGVRAVLAQVRPAYLQKFIDNAAANPKIAVFAYLQLPWAAPQAQTTSQLQHVAVLDIVAARLDGNAEAQEIFWGLAGEWAGTTGDLLDAALLNVHALT